MADAQKDPNAFRTISEAAKMLGLPQHVLRFWETKFIQIKPMKRAGGRRFYRPDDVHLLAGIRHLLYDRGYTIKGVQRVIKEKGVREIIDLGTRALNGEEMVLEVPQAAEPAAEQLADMVQPEIATPQPSEPYIEPMVETMPAPAHSFDANLRDELALIRDELVELRALCA